MSDSTQRFSNRVEHYMRARPGYPAALMDFMSSDLGLRREHVIADVGSGTGILTEMLLANGNAVFAVEPNEPMRVAAEQALGRYPNFRSIAGSAEQTGLNDASVDFITAAQAFHWFDPDRARTEFRRVFRPGGWVVLIWNDRLDTPGFGAEYGRILQKFNTDMDRVHHRNITEKHVDALDRLFGRGGYRTTTFSNFQQLDWDGVQARLLSSSYMPAADDPRATTVLAELKAAFDTHQRDGQVRLDYDTRVYYGQLP